MRVGPVVVTGLALLTISCGRAVAVAPAPAPEPASYQTLVAGAPDPEGNMATARFDSVTGHAQATAVPTNAIEARFAPAGAISYLLPDSIHTLDVAGGARTVATSPGRVIAGFAWSDGGVLAFVAHATAVGSGSQLVIQPPAGVARAIPLPPASGGAPPTLRFSSDGQLLLLVDPALGTQNTLQVRRLDGTLVYQAAGASEATWAGLRRLYYQDGRGVNAADLTSGATRTILPGIGWRTPDTSPDGRTVVFEGRDPVGRPCLELLDTRTDAVLPGFERDEAAAPRFVSGTEIWFRDVSGGAGAIVSLDVERRTEAPTGLTGVVSDVRQIG